MATTRFNGIKFFHTLGNLPIVKNGSFTLNAAGDHCQLIGYLWLPAATGSKTLSAAGGGHIYTSFNTVTWATASSEIRLGIEDVSGGFGDGTQDVYGAKIAGTNAITSNVCADFPMTSGSKTMSHGDFIAITFRMPVRANVDSLAVSSTDNSIFMTTTNVQSGQPYGINGAAGGAGSRTDSEPWALIKFDDGTFGWIMGCEMFFVNASSSLAFASNTTPDEYIGSFQVPVPTEISVIGAQIDNAAVSDDYELILYSDPYGSPSVIQAVTMQPNVNTNSGSTDWGILARITPVVLATATVYGVAIRPTTTGSISTYYLDAGSGFTDLKSMIPFFTNVKLASRTNQTGAFVETQTYHIPSFCIGVTGFDDAVVAASPKSYSFVG